MDAVHAHYPQKNTADVRAFWLMAVLTVLVYGGFCLFYAGDSHAHSRTLREAFLWPSLTALAALYIWGDHLLSCFSIRPTRAILIGGGMIALLCLVMTPFHSTDLYGYINRGWQQAQYHLNPYVFVVDDIPHWESDPVITNHWVNNPSPYGFLFVWLANLLCQLGIWLNPNHETLKTTLMILFKSGSLIAHLLTGWVLWLSAKQLQEKPGNTVSFLTPERVLYLWLWNPLILLHQVANGHNDLWMGFFLGVAAYLAIRDRWLWVLPALTLGAMIKYATLVVAPMALLFCLKRCGWKIVLISVLVSIGVVLLCGLPYLPDLASFQLGKIGENAGLTTNSLHSVVFGLYKTISRNVPMLYEWRPQVHGSLKALLWLGFLGTYVMVGFRWLLVLPKEQFTPQRFISAAFWVMFGLVCVVSTKFYPWYLAMFLPIALMTSVSEVISVLCFALTLSVFELFAFTVVGQAHFLNYLLLLGLPTLWLLGFPKSFPKFPTMVKPQEANMIATYQDSSAVVGHG